MLFPHTIDGYDDLLMLLKQLEETEVQQQHQQRAQVIFVHLTDSKLPDGKNWCEECANAEPIVQTCVQRLASTLEASSRDEDYEKMAVHWVTCHVGARDFWYNPNNPFRRDPQLRLFTIPALVCLFRAGANGSWMNTAKDLCQIYESEDHFASVATLERILTNFLDIAAERQGMSVSEGR
ncbi:hypothetical protein niasHT_029345 [Heterodera trifolii]|uniref:Thioredoxin domain-containing protein 17 n=1 Tax=Heterodera trifolii TaxID=157864 RepID=A0ABD2KMR5_9BILA